MTTMTTFERILFEVATKTIVPKKALLFCLPGRINVYRQIRRAKAKGLIREIKYSTRKATSVTKATVDALVLTPKGAQFVREEMKDIIPWATYLLGSEANIRIFGGKISDRVKVKYYTKISGAAVMATSIGAAEDCVYFSAHPEDIDDDIEDQLLDAEMDEMLGPYDGDEDGKSNKLVYSQLVARAVALYNEAKTEIMGTHPTFIPSDRSGIVFVDALAMKRSINNTDKTGNIGRDYSGRRYAGIIYTVPPLKEKSALIYSSTALSPLVWSRDKFMKEIDDLDVLADTLKDNISVPPPSKLTSGYYTEGGKANIIIIADNPSLVQLFFSKMRVTITETVRTSEGKFKEKKERKLFHSCIIVPYSAIGVSVLRAVMTTFYTIERDNIIDQLVATGKFRRLSSEYYFPLFDQQEVHCAVETQLDLVRLKEIVQRIKEDEVAQRFKEDEVVQGIKEDPEDKYAILCHRWQKPYLEEIMPEAVRLYPIEEVLPGFPLSGGDAVPILDAEAEADDWRRMRAL